VGRNRAWDHFEKTLPLSSFRKLEVIGLMRLIVFSNRDVATKAAASRRTPKNRCKQKGLPDREALGKSPRR